MNANKILLGASLLLACSAFGQEKGPSQFGCPATDRVQRTTFDPQPNLRFVEPTSKESIKQWLSRPMMAFQGFDAAKYGFTRAEFYRWHVPLREENPPKLKSDDVLYMQPSSESSPNNEQNEESQRTGSVPASDEMNDWLELALATPEGQLPLFILSYGYSEMGLYQVDTFKRYLLLDIRTGLPRISKAVSCDLVETFSGAGSAMDAASETSTDLGCDWEANSNDFRCKESVPYGHSHAARKAEREFYLLSNKKVERSASSNFVPGLEQLVLQIDKNPKSLIKGVLVSGLGPTTVLQRFDGLLPDAGVFVFASPGAGQLFNAHLSLVVAPSKGKPTVQPIPKWGIGGEKTDEEESPEGYTPSEANDVYRSNVLEERPGFRAFAVVLTARPDNNSVHVMYWVGLEVVDGKIVANAVRLASEDYAYEDYGQYFHESTAASVRQKAGVAEATVRIQGQFDYEQTDPYPTGEGNCVWSGLLHWKAGSGFRVRKLAEDCKAPHREVKITDDGNIQSVPAQNVHQ